MTIFVPIMLFGWVPFTIYLFFRLPSHRAVLVSVIGGWLLLPMAGYNLPGLPGFNKTTAISIGLILGGWFSGQGFRADFRWRIHDLPMILWCLSPIITSLTNQLGLYDGLSVFYRQVMTWGIPYYAGRLYFKNDEDLFDLCVAILVWGSLYALLCLYEIKMSPRLSINIYGFFPHEWRQHFRYGGWRPIVFMQHGLMVAVWISLAATTAFWLWRSRVVQNIKGIPLGIVVTLLIVTALLCKTASGWVILALGCGGYFVYRYGKTNLFFKVLLLSVPCYIFVRTLGIVPADTLEMLVAKIFDSSRTTTFALRLQQEYLFVDRALGSPLFGWGEHSRGWPIDPETGERLIHMVDALWIITLSSKGLFGLMTWVGSMLIGPYMILHNISEFREKMKESPIVISILLSLIVVLFMIDCLMNAMINPIYIMISGALSSWYLNTRKNTHQIIL